MSKLKTSISLPSNAENLWKQYRKTIQQFLSAHLQRYQTEKMRRIGLLSFNDCNEGLVRVNVYWDQATYDQLHAVAHALRMSVSHLLWQILNFVLSGEHIESIFSNYAFTKKEWSEDRFMYTEVIQFSQRPTTKTRKNYDNNIP